MKSKKAILIDSIREYMEGSMTVYDLLDIAEAEITNDNVHSLMDAKNEYIKLYYDTINIGESTNKYLDRYIERLANKLSHQ